MPSLDLPHAGTTGWGTLEALGIWLTDTIRPPADQDPIWPALAELDGREPGTRATVRLGEVTTRLSRLLARHDLLAETFAQPGTIAISRTHVDVMLGLNQIDLAARVSGLDRDPGWVPALGRIVLFHFGAGAESGD